MEEKYITLDETFMRRFGSYHVDTLPGSCEYLQNIVPYSMATVLHRRCDVNPNSLQEHQMSNIRYVSLVKDLPPDHFAYTIVSHSAECKKFIQFKNLDCVYMTITDRKTNEEVEKYEWKFQFVDYEDEQLEARVRELSSLMARQKFLEFFEGILKIPNTSRHNENDIIIKCGIYLNAGIPQYLRGIATPIPHGERKKRYTSAPIKVAKIQTKYHTVELSYSMQQCNHPTTSSPIIRELVEDKIKHSLATSTPCVPARDSSSGRSRFDPVISPFHYESFRDVVYKGSMATKKRCKQKTASPVNKESPTILRRALMATGVSPIQTNRKKCNPQNKGLKYTSIVVKPRDIRLAVKNLHPAPEHAGAVLQSNMEAKKTRRFNTEIMPTDAQTLPDRTQMASSSSCVFVDAVQKASEKVTNAALSSPKSANNDFSSNINKAISAITTTDMQIQPEQTPQTVMKGDKEPSISVIDSNSSKSITQVNTFSDRTATQKEPRQISNMPQMKRKKTSKPAQSIKENRKPLKKQKTDNNQSKRERKNTDVTFQLGNAEKIERDEKRPNRVLATKQTENVTTLSILIPQLQCVNSSFGATSGRNIKDVHSTFSCNSSAAVASTKMTSKKCSNGAQPSLKGAANYDFKYGDLSEIQKRGLREVNLTLKQFVSQNSSLETVTCRDRKFDIDGNSPFTSCGSRTDTASEKVDGAARPSQKSTGNVTSKGIDKKISKCIPTPKVLKRKIRTMTHCQLQSDTDEYESRIADKRPELEDTKKNKQEIPKGVMRQANSIRKQFVSQPLKTTERILYIDGNSSSIWCGSLQSSDIDDYESTSTHKRLKLEATKKNNQQISKTSTLRKFDIDGNSSFTSCGSLTETASEKVAGAELTGIQKKIFNSKCIPTPQATKKNDQQIPKGILREANSTHKQSVSQNSSFETETSSLRKFVIDGNSTFTSCGSLTERASEKVADTALPSPKSAGSTTSKGIKTKISKCIPTPKVLKRKIRTMTHCQLQSDIDEYESRICDKRPEFEDTKKNKQEIPKGVMRQANSIRKQFVSQNSSIEANTERIFDIDGNSSSISCGSLQSNDKRLELEATNENDQQISKTTTLKKFDIDGNSSFTSCGSLTETASEKVAGAELKGIQKKIFNSKCIPTPQATEKNDQQISKTSTLRKFDIDGNSSFTSCDSAKPVQITSEKLYGHTQLESMPFYTAQEEFHNDSSSFDTHTFSQLCKSMRSVGDMTFGSEFGSGSASSNIRANRRMTASHGIMELTFERRSSPLSSLDRYAVSQATTATTPETLT